VTLGDGIRDADIVVVTAHLGELAAGQLAKRVCRQLSEEQTVLAVPTTTEVDSGLDETAQDGFFGLVDAAWTTIPYDLARINDAYYGAEMDELETRLLSRFSQPKIIEAVVSAINYRKTNCLTLRLYFDAASQLKQRFQQHGEQSTQPCRQGIPGSVRREHRLWTVIRLRVPTGGSVGYPQIPKV